MTRNAMHDLIDDMHEPDRKLFRLNQHIHVIPPRWWGGYFCAMLTPITLAIIEDQAPIREALQEYLRAQPEFECGIVVDSVEAFLEALDAGAMPPQLLLSDIGLSGYSGIEGAATYPGAPARCAGAHAERVCRCRARVRGPVRGGRGLLAEKHASTAA